MKWKGKDKICLCSAGLLSLVGQVMPERRKFANWVLFRGDNTDYGLFLREIGIVSRISNLVVLVAH